MGWTPANEPIDNLIEVCGWIKNNSSEIDKVASPVDGEVRYYCGRDVYWLTPSGGVEFYNAFARHENEALREVVTKEGIKYILIPMVRVTRGIPSTPGVIKYDDYLFLKSSPVFKMVYSKPGVEVFSVGK